MSAENLLILFTILIVIYLFSIVITTLMDSQRSEGDRRGATKNAVLYGEKLNLTVSDMANINKIDSLDQRCVLVANKILCQISPNSIYEINFNYWTIKKIEEFIFNSTNHLRASGCHINYSMIRTHVMRTINQVRIEQI